MLGIFITFQDGQGGKLKKQSPSLIEYAHLHGGGERGGSQVGRARGTSVGASQGVWPLLLSPWGTYVSGSRYKGVSLLMTGQKHQL